MLISDNCGTPNVVCVLFATLHYRVKEHSGQTNYKQTLQKLINDSKREHVTLKQYTGKVQFGRVLFCVPFQLSWSGVVVGFRLAGAGRVEWQCSGVGCSRGRILTAVHDCTFERAWSCHSSSSCNSLLLFFKTRASRILKAT